MQFHTSVGVELAGASAGATGVWAACEPKNHDWSNESATFAFDFPPVPFLSRLGLGALALACYCKTRTEVRGQRFEVQRQQIARWQSSSAPRCPLGRRHSTNSTQWKSCMRRDAKVECGAHYRGVIAALLLVGLALLVLRGFG